MTLTPLRLRFLVIALFVTAFIGALDHTVVSTSLATIAGELGALEHLSWIVVGYTLASTVLLPVIGKLGDVIGPRRIFIWSLVGFIAASVACGFADSMTWLIIARVLQGMCSAGMQLMSQTIIARLTSPRERTKYMAVIGAAFPAAILLGPLVGGLITDYWGWPWIFWINIPVGIVSLALILIAVPNLPGGAHPRFDIAGSITFTLALVALVLGVTWIGNDQLWTIAIGCFAFALLAFAVFALIQVRSDAPILPLGMFRNRAIAAGIALSAIIGIGLFSVTAYLPTYFQMAYGTSATVSGFVPIATVFGMLVSNLATGWLVSRSGHYRAYPIIGTSMGAAGLFIMSVLPLGLPLWVPMAVMALVGLGTGSFMSLVVTVVQSAVPSTELGVVTASINLVRQVGSTVATAVLGGVIGSGAVALLPIGLNAATLTPQNVHAAGAAVQAEVAAVYHQVFAPIYLGLAVVYAIGIIAALLLPHGRLSDEPSPTPDEPVVAGGIERKEST